MVGRGRKHIWSMVAGGHCEHIWRAVVGNSVSTYWGWCWVDLASPFGRLLLKWTSQNFCFHSVLGRKKHACRPSRRFGGQTKVLSKKQFVSTLQIIKHLKINFPQFYFLQIQAKPFPFSTGKTDRKVKLFSRHYSALKWQGPDRQVIII